LLTELEPVYKEASSAKAKDASILFRAMEKTLEGTALTEWHDVINEEAGRTWESFKNLVSTFICKKVIMQEDAYYRQQQYLMERRMPLGMDVHEWWLRMQTINRYLPYFFPTQEKLKKWFPTANWKDWWNLGGLSEQELKSIITTRLPQSWIQELERVDVGRRMRDDQTTDALVDYFGTLQRLEQSNRKPISRIAGGQCYGRGRGGRIGPYYYQQQYGSAYPGRGSPYQSGRERPYQYTPAMNRGSVNPRGSVYPPNNYSAVNSQRAHPSSGRGGTTTPFRRAGQPGAQQAGRSFQRGSQGQQQGMRHYQQPNQPMAYYQEQEDVQDPQEPEDDAVAEETAAENEQFEFGEATEEELIDRWNEQMMAYATDENLFMEAEEQSFYDAEEEEDGYYGEQYL